jgi:hypothetical protein
VFAESLHKPKHAGGRRRLHDAMLPACASVQQTCSEGVTGSWRLDIQQLPATRPCTAASHSAAVCASVPAALCTPVCTRNVYAAGPTSAPAHTLLDAWAHSPPLSPAWMTLSPQIQGTAVPNSLCFCAAKQGASQCRSGAQGLLRPAPLLEHQAQPAP